MLNSEVMANAAESHHLLFFSNMFAIRVLPISQSPDDSLRLGEIVIGNFTERFACHSIGSTTEVADLERVWRRELRKLVDGAIAVALVYDPRFAWIIYGAGRHCFIQQKFASDGKFSEIESRRTHTVDGDAISEWRVDLLAIQKFLDTE